MPLIQSKSKKKAMNRDSEMELDSGKPQKPSIAIAYAVQRKNKGKKMASGGHVHDESCMADGGMCKYADGGQVAGPTLGSIINYPGSDKTAPKNMAHGGMAHSDERDAMIEAIIEKRRNKKEKMMADGGEVDIEDNGEEQPMEYEDRNADAIKKELYDDSQLEDQPLDSKGDSEEDSEENKRDRVSRIRAKMRGMRS